MQQYLQEPTELPGKTINNKSDIVVTDVHC